MRWAVNVAHIEMRNGYEILLESMKEDKSVDGG
jgi:hypothetical protein